VKKRSLDQSTEAVFDEHFPILEKLEKIEIKNLLVQE